MMNRSLAAIGLVGDQHRIQPEFLALLADAAGETLSCSDGEYKLWRSKEGAEVWFHVVSDAWVRSNDCELVPGRRIVAVTPFHATKRTVKVTVTGIMSLDRRDPLAGAYVCYLPSLRDGDRELQVVLEMVPFARTEHAPLPFTMDVELLGLTVEATVYSSLTDFFVRIASSRLVAPSAVVPLLNNPGTEAARAGADLRCHAVITGRVCESERIVNTLTGLAYRRLVVATERGELDLVAAESSIDGEPSVGSIIQAKARMVGRAATHPVSLANAPATQSAASDGAATDSTLPPAEPRRRAAY